MNPELISAVILANVPIIITLLVLYYISTKIKNYINRKE